LPSISQQHAPVGQPEELLDELLEELFVTEPQTPSQFNIVVAYCAYSNVCVSKQ
jgi:hypothetical protein